MADVSVNSAALDKLSASLEGQTIALKALTESNQRAILQKDETVNISGVATRGGGVRPYDEVTANAIASGNQPLVDALNKDKEPGILSKLLKGIFIGGVGYLIYKGISSAPEIKEKFKEGVKTIKDFFIGDNGIISRAYDFLFKEGEGKEAGILRRMGKALLNLLPESLQTKFTETLDKVKEFISNIPFLLPYLENTFSDLKTSALDFFDSTFESLKKKVKKLFNGLMDNTITPYFMNTLLPKLTNYLVGEDGLIEQLKDKIPGVVKTIRDEIPGVVKTIKDELPGLRKKLEEEFGIFTAFIRDDLAIKLNQLIDKLGLRGLIDKFEGMATTAKEIKKKVNETKEQGRRTVSQAEGIVRAFFGFKDKGYEERQLGGPVRAGGMYTVGEGGPETFVPGSPGTILPNIVKPIQKLGDDIVTELSSGSIVRGLDSLGDKMDNLAASMAGGSGVVTVPGAEGPGTNYNGVYEQRSLVR